MSEHEPPPSTNPSDIEALISRLKQSNLSESDSQLAERLFRLLLTLIHLVERKNTSIARLKRLLFGPSSDNRSPRPIPKQVAGTPAIDETTNESAREENEESNATAQQKRRGHGRLSSALYTGAAVVACQDSQLRAGSSCPETLCQGHLYDTHSPSILIRLEGQPLVGATRYEQAVLRCSTCQQRYTAPLPEAVPPQKYAASCDVAITVAKYSAGLPFHRLAKMQQAFGVPLPASVQFERVEQVADAVLPVFLHLRSLAAQGQVLYGDDTRVKILSCLKENKQLSDKQRRGLQTSGIVSRLGDQQIVLYTSGRRHAGENLDELLRLRSRELAAPLQMGDALAVNWSREFETVVCKCLAHARRQFIDIENAFPVQCKRVLDDLGAVYKVDAQTRGMSDEERLVFHQQQSASVFKSLRAWIDQQTEERLVEPNSSLGKAFAYLTKHWDGLTRVLTVAGAPIDNNVVERALKLAILNRKNALFYRTEHGAAIGDILTSLIGTCRLNGISEWSYLLALIENSREVRREPQRWLPWNYRPCEVQRQAA